MLFLNVLCQKKLFQCPAVNFILHLRVWTRAVYGKEPEARISDELDVENNN